MKKKNHFPPMPVGIRSLLLATALSLGMTGCVDSSIDNPVTPLTPNETVFAEQVKGTWIYDIDGIKDVDYMGISFTFGDDGKVTMGFFYYAEEIDDYFPLDLGYTYRCLNTVQVNGKTLFQIEMTPTAETIELMRKFSGGEPWDPSFEESSAFYVEATGDELRFLDNTELATPYTVGEQAYDMAVVFKYGTYDISSFDKAKAKEFTAQIREEMEQMGKGEEQPTVQSQRARKAPATSAGGRTLKTWMKDIPDTTKVRNLLLPGAHDCGSFGMEGGYMTTFGKTQMVNLYDQFAWGTRVFDLRTRQTKGVNRIYHDMISCNITLEDALFSIKNSLKENPTEGAVITIKGEGNEANNGIKSVGEWIAQYLGSDIGGSVRTVAEYTLNKYLTDARIFTLDYTVLDKVGTTKETVRLLETMFYNDGMLAKFEPDMTMKDLRGKALVILQDYDDGGLGWGSIGNHVALSKNHKYFTPSGSASVEVTEQNNWDQESNQTETAYVDQKDAEFKAKLQESTTAEKADMWVVNACNGFFLDGGTKLPDYITFASREYPRMIASVAATPGSRGMCIQDYVGCDYVRHAPLFKLFTFYRGWISSGAVILQTITSTLTQDETNYVRMVIINNFLAALEDAPKNNTYGQKLTEAIIERNFSDKVQSAVTLVPYNGNFTEGKGHESYKQIFDGDPQTKWCMENTKRKYLFFKKYIDCFAEFRTTEPVSPKGFTITTASDTEVFPGRNPVDFMLWGKKKADDDYELIDSRTLDLPKKNCASKSYSFIYGGTHISGMQYFRISIMSNEDIDSGWMQFSEFDFTY